MVKNPLASVGVIGSIHGLQRSLKKEMAIHVNPWPIHVNLWQKPLQYCKVISLQLIKINGINKSQGEKKGNGNPLQDSCLGNPMDRGAWRAAVHGVAKSQIQLSYQTATAADIITQKFFNFGLFDQVFQIHSFLCFMFFL